MVHLIIANVLPKCSADQPCLWCSGANAADQSIPAPRESMARQTDEKKCVLYSTRIMTLRTSLGNQV